MTKASKRPGRPPAESIATPTPDRILQFAAQLFMEQGYDAVSIDEVAKQTGITKAMVYYYFSSKSGLFTAAMIRMMEIIRERTKAILERNLPLRDRLLSVAIARLSIKEPRYNFENLLRSVENTLSQEQRDCMLEAERHLRRILSEAILRAIETRELRMIDAALVVDLYIALLDAGEHQIRRVPIDKRNAETVANYLLDLFWYGVGEPSESLGYNPYHNN